MKKAISLWLALALLTLACGVAFAEDAPLTEDIAQPYTYTEEDILVQADGYQIPATLTMPVGAEGEVFPAVIMCHGNGSTRHEAGNGYDTAAPALAICGIASIRFDYIGNGDSDRPYTEFTYDTGVSDAMTCLAYLESLPNVDDARIGIMGWSQGGGIALMTAGRNPGDFVSCVTWAGACYDGAINEEEYAIAQKDGYFEQTYDWREPLQQSAAYYECALKTRVVDDVANFQGPVLAINGELDTVVPPETARKIVDASSNEDSDVYIVDGADHTFNIFTGDFSAFDELISVTLLFFLATL